MYVCESGMSPGTATSPPPPMTPPDALLLHGGVDEVLELAAEVVELCGKVTDAGLRPALHPAAARTTNRTVRRNLIGEEPKRAALAVYLDSRPVRRAAAGAGSVSIPMAVCLEQTSKGTLHARPVDACGFLSTASIGGPFSHGARRTALANTSYVTGIAALRSIFVWHTSQSPRSLGSADWRL